MRGLCRFLTVMVLGLAACTTDTGVKPYWTVRDSILQIKPGMTKAEVLKLAGNPIMTFNFDRMQQESWLYDYLEGQIRMKSWVHFKTPEGVVKYYTQEYDSAYYSGESH
jgi:outer membrane protein assembly factor BamE (lipoprotein component of BamABCDE complex)